MSSNQRVAIKRISSDVFKDPFLTHRILREIWMMAHFRGHPNVMGLLDIAPLPQRNFNSLFIMMELMDHDLKTVLRSGQPLTEEHIQFFIYQILCGLLYVHKAGVVHRDITPANVLVNANCDIKICDFGLARSLQRNDVELTDYVTMRWYRAPELVMEDVQYTHQVDVWGCGCILAEFLSPNRGILFPGEDRIKQLGVILNVIGTPSDEDMAGVGSEMARKYIRKHHSNLKGIDFTTRFRSPTGEPLTPDALDLLQRMLRFNPKKRISVIEAMRHPYLKEFYDPDDEMNVEPFNLDNTPFENLNDLNIVKTLIFNTVSEIRRELLKEQQPTMSSSSSSTITPPPEKGSEEQGTICTTTAAADSSNSATSESTTAVADSSAGGSSSNTSTSEISSATAEEVPPGPGDSSNTVSLATNPLNAKQGAEELSSSFCNKITAAAHTTVLLTTPSGSRMTPLRPAERIPSSSYYADTVGMVIHSKADALSDGEWSESDGEDIDDDETNVVLNNNTRIKSDSSPRSEPETGQN